MTEWVAVAKKEAKRIKIKCFYCDALVSRDESEDDHFPIPASHGGSVTVVSCKTCHNMKDRFLLDDWDDVWISKVVGDMPKLNRETRIFMAKLMRIFFQFVPCETTAHREGE